MISDLMDFEDQCRMRAVSKYWCNLNNIHDPNKVMAQSGDEYKFKAYIGMTRWYNTIRIPKGGIVRSCTMMLRSLIRTIEIFGTYLKLYADNGTYIQIEYENDMPLGYLESDRFIWDSTCEHPKGVRKKYMH